MNADLFKEKRLSFFFWVYVCNFAIACFFRKNKASKAKPMKKLKKDVVFILIFFEHHLVSRLINCRLLKC